MLMDPNPSQRHIGPQPQQEVIRPKERFKPTSPVVLLVKKYLRSDARDGQPIPQIPGIP